MSYSNSIYADDRLPSRAKLVYMYLHSRANKEGICWPAVGTIAKELKISRSTVKRALLDLELCGYIWKDHRYRENGGRTSNLYTITKMCLTS
mgnify:CR=1 FL=1